MSAHTLSLGTSRKRTSSVTLFSTLIAVLTIGAFFALPQVADALQP